MKTIGNQDPKISAIITAEEAEELQLTEKDLQLIAEMYERFLKANE
jgi:hypothetical protein